MNQRRKPRKPQYMTRVARKLRSEPTRAEGIIWECLRNRRFGGAKFRRQVPVGRYVLDMYCHDRRLAIEIDGESHRATQEYDKHRDEYLRSVGIQTIRIPNDQVIEDLRGVLELIAQHLTPDPPLP